MNRKNRIRKASEALLGLTIYIELPNLDPGLIRLQHIKF